MPQCLLATVAAFVLVQSAWAQAPQGIEVVWDFNFADPKSVGFVFNNLAALIKATED